MDITSANNYFLTRVSSTIWDNASDVNKLKAITTAINIFRNLNWIGLPTGDGIFPRTGEYFEPETGSMQDADSLFATRRYEEAVYEQAYHLLLNTGLLDEDGEYRSVKLESLAVNNVLKPPKLSSTVKALIKPLLCNSEAVSWWRFA